jgi:putative serine protease PepD
MGDPFPSGSMVSHRAEEQGDRSDPRAGNEAGEHRCVDPAGPDGDVITSAWYGVVVHRIHSMADTTPADPDGRAESGSRPGEPEPAAPDDDVAGEQQAPGPEPSATEEWAGATGGTAGPPLDPNPGTPEDLNWVIPGAADVEPASGTFRHHPDAGVYPPAAGPAESAPHDAASRSVPPARPGGSGRLWRAVGLAAASGILGAALAATAVWWLIHDDGEQAPAAVTVVERVETQILTPQSGESTAAAVARRVLPSIVTVEVTTTSVGDFVADGSGSGVVLTSDGLLVTNEHVVEDAVAVRVVFADGRIYDAEVIGGDPLSDLALIRIPAEGLTPIERGSADAMVIGDPAIAIGSPLGLGGGPSVTVGVISAFDRRVQTGADNELFGMLQTDAPITRGSSGGALVDAQGRLIGITTAIGVSDVGAEGLGFAIPIEMVNRITDDLLDDGAVSHAFLGIEGTTHFEEAPDGATIPAGVTIASVVEGTAAQLAGLQPGDLIRSVDGIPVATMEQLVVRIRLYRVGDTVELVTDRDGEPLTISMTLMERPEGV